MDYVLQVGIFWIYRMLAAGFLTYVVVLVIMGSLFSSRSSSRSASEAPNQRS
jgi:hypothetical protein